MKANPKFLPYGAVALALAATLFVIFHVTGEKNASQAAAGVITIPSTPSSPATPRAASGPPPPPSVLPTPLASALKLEANAKLRDPLPAGWQSGILCGQVSPSGNGRDYRRFVYNGPGGTGAMDDGSDLFRRFADKICLLQPKG